MREHIEGRRLDWWRDGRDWPLREHSRFVAAGGLTWHVQQLGSGPCALLVHGTGAASHSWRGLAPLLAREWTVLAPDLPGHGFSTSPGPGGWTLPGMADGLAALLARLELVPALVIGHSAGAAVLAQLCLEGRLHPRLLVAVNGALLPFGGIAGRLFSPLARVLAGTSLVPRVFARQAATGPTIERLIDSTGSRIDRTGVECYRRLAGNPAHAAAALAMMAHWDLQALAMALPRLAPPLLLVTGSRDRTLPPAEALRVAERVPGARCTSLPGLGHLAHEERPDLVHREVEAALAAVG